ncbi:unnamed protein product, partial [Onchocerca ochengi]|uniref:Uncharacterized protein n=1 Tax=Onchocerca ochengi TaxID=42157 RepID=A0A182EYZ1_ONCOC
MSNTNDAKFVIVVVYFLRSIISICKQLKNQNNNHGGNATNYRTCPSNLFA